MSRYRRDFGNRSYYGHLITKDQLNEGTAKDGEPGLQQAIHNEIVELNNNRYGLLSGFETSISSDVVTIGEGTVLLDGNLIYSSGGTVSGVSDGDYIYLWTGGFHAASSIDDVSGLIVTYVSGGATYDDYRAGLYSSLPGGDPFGRVGFAHEYVEKLHAKRANVDTGNITNCNITSGNATRMSITSGHTDTAEINDLTAYYIHGTYSGVMDDLYVKNIHNSVFADITSADVASMTVDEMTVSNIISGSASYITINSGHVTGALFMGNGDWMVESGGLMYASNSTSDTVKAFVFNDTDNSRLAAQTNTGYLFSYADTLTVELMGYITYDININTPNANRLLINGNHNKLRSLNINSTSLTADIYIRDLYFYRSDGNPVEINLHANREVVSIENLSIYSDVFRTNIYLYFDNNSYDLKRVILRNIFTSSEIYLYLVTYNSSLSGTKIIDEVVIDNVDTDVNIILYDMYSTRKLYLKKVTVNRFNDKSLTLGTYGTGDQYSRCIMVSLNDSYLPDVTLSNQFEIKTIIYNSCYLDGAYFSLTSTRASAVNHMILSKCELTDNITIGDSSTQTVDYVLLNLIYKNGYTITYGYGTGYKEGSEIT